MLTALVALALAQVPAAPPSPAIRLQALRATSGAGAERLLDGDALRGWTPEGDPRDEGVLLRFEAPVAVDRIRLTGCGGPLLLTAVVNGSESTPLALDAAASEVVLVRARTGRVKTLFVSLRDGGKSPCLGEVTFLKGGEALTVLPPREVAGRVLASSNLEPAAAYHPSYLVDGRTDFGWVEGVAGPGEGEVITVELERPVDLRAIELWNGYQRSDVHFRANARARRVEVSRDGGEPEAVEVQDRTGAQKLALRPAPPASLLRLRIASAYPGARYQDLVLSELRLWDAEGPVGIQTADGEALELALVKAVADTPVAAILDRRLVEPCGLERPRRTLKLRHDHSLVAYETDCSSELPSSCVTSVLDGTWVLAGHGGGWAEIDLFARRHRIDARRNPYAENAGALRESDEIAGGKLRIAVAAQLSVEALRSDEANQAPFLEPGCSTADHGGRVLVRGRALSADFVLDAR